MLAPAVQAARLKKGQFFRIAEVRMQKLKLSGFSCTTLNREALTSFCTLTSDFCNEFSVRL